MFSSNPNQTSLKISTIIKKKSTIHMKILSQNQHSKMSVSLQSTNEKNQNIHYKKLQTYVRSYVKL